MFVKDVMFAVTDFFFFFFSLVSCLFLNIGSDLQPNKQGQRFSVLVSLSLLQILTLANAKRRLRLTRGLCLQAQI